MDAAQTCVHSVRQYALQAESKYGRFTLHVALQMAQQEALHFVQTRRAFSGAHCRHRATDIIAKWRHVGVCTCF
jgi:hypothetical protein